MIWLATIGIRVSGSSTPTAAAIGAGVGLLVNGLNTQAKLMRGERGEDGLVRSDLTGSEAQSANSSATLQLGLAAGAGAAGLALGVTAIVVW